MNQSVKYLIVVFPGKDFFPESPPKDFRGLCEYLTRLGAGPDSEMGESIKVVPLQIDNPAFDTRGSAVARTVGYMALNKLQYALLFAESDGRFIHAFQ